MPYDRDELNSRLDALIAATPLSDYEIVRGVQDRISVAIGRGIRIMDLHGELRKSGFRGNCAKFTHILEMMGMYVRKKGRRRKFDNFQLQEGGSKWGPGG